MDKVYIFSRDLSTCYIRDKYFKNKDFYSVDELIGIIEDLDDKLEQLQEEYDDFKKQVEDNYKPLSQAELIGWSEEW